MKEQIYFAWVDDLYVPFDPAVHATIAEGEFSLIRLSQRENQAAMGEITFPNPGVGLLSASRRRFVLVSESETGDPADAVLVARARILGMPTDFRADLITTQIICAPDDLDERLADAAEAHFQLPYADPLFGDERRNPTDAIAARGCSWHIDPRTHEITITDVLGGGPLVDVGYDHAGDFSIRVGEPPAKKAKMRVVVEWEQGVEGWTDIAEQIGPTTTMSVGDPVDSYTTELGAAKSVFDAPNIEINDGVGWTVGKNAFNVVDEDQIALFYGWKREIDYDGFQYSHSVRVAQIGTSSNWVWKHYYDSLGKVQELWKRVDETRIWTYEWQQMIAKYQYRQQRREVVELEMTVPVQDVHGAVSVMDMGEIRLDDPTDDVITPVWYEGRPGLTGEAVLFDGKRWTYKEDGAPGFVYFYNYVDGTLLGLSTPYFDAAPRIAPLDRRSPYFVGSDRAEETIRHALLLMRAKLRYGLRGLEATVRPGDWSVMRDITMAHSLRADHPRFGAVTGKVIAWERVWAGGQSPGRTGTITIGACLGTGSTGAGVVEDVDYTVDAEDAVVPVNAFALSSPAYAVIDVHRKNELDDQIALIESEMAAGHNPATALNKAMTEISVTLRPLTSVGVIERKINVSAALLDSPMGYDAGAD